MKRRLLKSAKSILSRFCCAASLCVIRLDAKGRLDDAAKQGAGDLRSFGVAVGGAVQVRSIQILRLAYSVSTTANSQSNPSEPPSAERFNQPPSPAPPGRMIICTVAIVPAGIRSKPAAGRHH